MNQTIRYGAGRPQSFWASLRRGFAGRCPSCGGGRLLHRYLKAHERCAACGMEFESLRSDDVPPYVTIFIVGHVIVPLVLLVEQQAAPPVWVQLAVWLPATLILSLALLPYVKGAAMAAIWHLKARDPSDIAG